MFVAHATVNGEHSGVSARRCGCQVRSDLARQLAGRCHHKPLRGTRLGKLGIVTFARYDDPLQQRDTEREGLSRTGTCLTDHVRAGQGDGNGQRLNRKRCGDADLVEGLHNRVYHADIGKSGRRDRRLGDFRPWLGLMNGFRAQNRLNARCRSMSRSVRASCASC
jgi:hypothetical protein